MAENARSCGFFDAPIITTFHGYDAFPAGCEVDDLRQYYKVLFENGDIFTVNGSYLKKRLIELGCKDEKIHTIPMGIDIDFFKPSQLDKYDSSKINLISVGRLIPLKVHKYGLMIVSKLINLEL